MRKLIVLLFLYSISLNCISQNNQNELKYLILSSKYTEALDLCNKLLKENPDDANLYYNQALINKLAFRYSRAKNSILMAIELDSMNVDYLAEFGFILLKIDNDKEAQIVFEEVIEMNPYHVNCGISLSNMYLKEKKDEKTEMAEKILLDLYSKDTTNGYLARSIGLCGYKLGDSKKSIKWFSRAIDLDSTDIKAYKYLFTTYAAKEEIELAYEVVDEAIKLFPMNIKLYRNVGDLYVVQNHHFKAVDAYLKVLEIDSEDEVAPGKLGLSYLAIKKYEKAKHYLLYAEKLNMDLNVCRGLASIYKITNKPDSSIIFSNKALEILKPDNYSIFRLYRNIADNYFYLNDYTNSIEMYIKAIELDIDTSVIRWIKESKNSILIDIASIYADKMNDKEKAIHYFKKVSNNTTYYIDKDKDYYKYAQEQIKLINEQLFMEGKLKM